MKPGAPPLQDIADAHRDALAAAADALMAQETLMGSELEALLDAHPPSRPLQQLSLSPGVNGSGGGGVDGGGNGSGHDGGSMGNGAAGAPVRQTQGVSAQ